jgi:general secretion pathway protein G
MGGIMKNRRESYTPPSKGGVGGGISLSPKRRTLPYPLPKREGQSRTRAFGGFTLIELLLVLVILGVLAALVVPKFVGRGEQARITAAKADISSIKTALNAFEIDTGRYPTTEEGLTALVSQPSGVQNWHGYLDNVPKDPWGNPYQFRSPGQHNPEGFDVYSFGPDGREGNDDIGNWNQ